MHGAGGRQGLVRGARPGGNGGLRPGWSGVGWGGRQSLHAARALLPRGCATLLLKHTPLGGSHAPLQLSWHRCTCTQPRRCPPLGAPARAPLTLNTFSNLVCALTCKRAGGARPAAGSSHMLARPPEPDCRCNLARTLPPTRIHTALTHSHRTHTRTRARTHTACVSGCPCLP